MRKVVFIVNGTETIVDGNHADTVKQLSEKALEQVDSLRPLSDYQVTWNDKWLQLDYSLLDQRETDNKGKRKNKKITIPDDAIIFISLKAGQGA